MKELVGDKEEAIPKPGNYKLPVSGPGEFQKRPLKGPLTCHTLSS